MKKIAQNKKALAVFLTILFLFVTASAQAARVPKEKTAKRIITHYFHKYGHKYKTSDFGTYKVEEVSVGNIEEIHKNMAAVIADVKLKNGPIYRVRCVLEKKSLGWRFISWEKL